LLKDPTLPMFYWLGLKRTWFFLYTYSDHFRIYFQWSLCPVYEFYVYVISSITMIMIITVFVVPCFSYVYCIWTFWWFCELVSLYLTNKEI
jgi:hypothetical protein